MQDIEILALNFRTPFFGGSRKAERAAEQLGVPLRVIDISTQHLRIVLNPKYGYGKQMNPCIDCHALMVREAGRVMEEQSARFIVTGEVLRQRPKSQNLQALKIVERESGYEGLVLRPLSAKLLPPTIPEQEGWVCRERLLDISGRSRKRQMELAARLGITEYSSPGGGCILTDPSFARRFRGLLDETPRPSLNDVYLLTVGRHFRLQGAARLVVGRNAAENERIASLASRNDVLMKVRDHPGPTALLRGSTEHAVQELAAAITARYSDATAGQPVTVVAWRPDGGTWTHEVVPAVPGEHPEPE